VDTLTGNPERVHRIGTRLEHHPGSRPVKGKPLTASMPRDRTACPHPKTGHPPAPARPETNTWKQCQKGAVQMACEWTMSCKCRDSHIYIRDLLVGPAGLEPATYGLKGRPACAVASDCPCLSPSSKNCHVSRVSSTWPKALVSSGQIPANRNAFPRA
jgi:hypothetical protein